jgi:hypothetical protein
MAYQVKFTYKGKKRKSEIYRTKRYAKIVKDAIISFDKRTKPKIVKV